MLLDAAMDEIEKENPTLKGVLPKAHAREDIDKRLLGELVDLIGNIGFTSTDDHGADDVLGRVYEYFLGKFAATEGREWAMLRFGPLDALPSTRTSCAS